MVLPRTQLLSVLLTESSAAIIIKEEHLYFSGGLNGSKFVGLGRFLPVLSCP